MNTTSALLPGVLLLVLFLIAAVNQSTSNKTLFGWGTGKAYTKDAETDDLIRRRLAQLRDEYESRKGVSGDSSSQGIEQPLTINPAVY